MTLDAWIVLGALAVWGFGLALAFYIAYVRPLPKDGPKP